ncbi:MAG: WYL domain-containing protein [Streptosporangiaceae bacterium]
MAATASNPVPLSAAEIASLALSLAHLGAGPQSTAARQALGHLLATAPASADDTVTASLATLTEPLDADTAHRAKLLAAAICDRRVVRLHYRDERGKVSSREIEPVTTLVHGDHWYLVGWCRLRHGIRAFRFDRMVAVEPSDLRASSRRPEQYLPFQRRVAAPVQPKQARRRKHAEAA